MSDARRIAVIGSGKIGQLAIVLLSERYEVKVYDKGEDDERRYRGQMKDGQPHGRGIMEWSNSKERYDGQWRKGERHGQGKYINFIGWSYEGQWQNDKKHGLKEIRV